jgi:hypothetical protein
MKGIKKGENKEIKKDLTRQSEVKKQKKRNPEYKLCCNK